MPTTDVLMDALAEFVLKAQDEAIEKKGKFSLAISGGSLPKQLAKLVGNPAAKWDKWYVGGFLILMWALSQTVLQASLLRR